MSGFDPAQATAAYLAALPPAVRRAAEIHIETGHWLWVADGVVMLAACWLLLKLDVLSRLRSRIEARQGRPWLAALACATVLAGVMVVLATAVEAVGAAMSGQPSPPDPHGLWFVLAMLVLPVLYAAVRAAPRWWWAWSGAVFAVLVLIVVWLPFASASGPAEAPTAPSGVMRDALLAASRASGLDVHEIYLSPGTGVDADVTGLQGRPRVSVTRGFLAQTPAQARASFGHLASHQVHMDQLGMAVLIAALGVGLFYAVQSLFAPVAAMMGRGGLALADPAGLPVATIIGVVWLGLATVGYNNFVRLINVRADQYSLDHVREPDGLAQALLVSDRADKVDPSVFEEAMFYNHPALQGRIAHAMRWKAEHR